MRRLYFCSLRNAYTNFEDNISEPNTDRYEQILFVYLDFTLQTVASTT